MKQSKEEMVQEGVKLSREGNHQGAVVLFKNALEKDPNFFEARYQLGIAYLETGKPEKAESEFQKVALQGAGKFPDLPLKLAEVYLRKENPDGAIDEVDKYLKANPEKSEAFELLGRAQALKKNYQEAERQFLKALDLDPGNLEAGINLARVLMQLKRHPEARQRLLETTGKHPKSKVAWFLLAHLESANRNVEGALKAYEKIGEIDPKDVIARFMKGRILLSQGKIDEGEQIAEGILKQAANSQQGLLLKGLAQYLRKDYNGALISLQSSLKSRPDLMGHYFLGLSHYNLDQHELAINQFQKSLDIAPGFVQARAMLAMTLLKQKRFDDAITEGEKALAMGSDNGLIHNLIGSAYMGQGRFEEAMEEFDKAIELNPNLADAHLKKGLYFLRQGDSEKAESQLEEAVALAPEAMNSRIILATHYLRRQNYDGAVQTLKEGLKGGDQDAVLYNYMALAAFSQSKDEEAIGYLEKAKIAKPDFLVPYFNLAAHFAKKGDFTKAREQYAGILAKEPRNVRALVGTALTHEMEGQDQKALEYFLKAKETKEPAGYLGLVKYHGQKKETEEVLKTLDEGLQAHPKNLSLLAIKGQVLLGKKDLKAAESVYREMEALSPGKGYPVLAQIFQRQGEVKKAEDLAGEVIGKAPKSPYGYVLLASIQENQKNLKAAEETLARGLNQNPDNPSLRMGLASLYEKQGRSSDALPIYRSLLEKNPRFYPARYALGAYFDRTGDKKAAVEYYSEVLKTAKNHTPTLNNLAYLYAVNYGDPDKALDLAMRAYRNEPGSPYVLDTLGFILLGKGRHEEALNLLRKADALLPGNKTIGYHLAQAYNRQGKKDEAKALLKKALEADGDFPERKEAAQLLREIGK
ncbi:MAG: PEP-CTERM system TPR-repeat protein PrsT [Deltaproteobacteria bacterium]|nr:PEP-CTERM system TPR-repeat protein PrsT [Deltaproteobacteria bacterium]